MKVKAEFIDHKQDYERLVWYTKAFIITSFLLFSAFVVVSIAKAQEVDMRIIAKIESSNNPAAFNKVSKARGLYQVTPICLKEYNQRHKTLLPEGSLYDSKTCYEVANWYMNFRIPQLLKHYRKEDSLKNRLWCYNAGIGKMLHNVLPAETKNYILKYERLVRK